MAGILKPRTLNDGVMAFQSDTWDVSGTGVGPFIPVTVTLDGTGTPTSGGGGGSTVTWTQTIVTLVAATAAPLIAVNASRKALIIENSGTNPFTYVPGAGPAIAGSGKSLNPPSASGFQGGAQDFAGELSTQAFNAISTLGTTVVVWEGV